MLIFDCQATGGRPEKNHLIEVGWIRTTAVPAAVSNPPPVFNTLVGLPPGATLPPPVARLTGITETDLIDGQSTDTVWRHLNEDARRVSSTSGGQRCPLVIHFARFEKPYLKRLHKMHSSASVFPFDIICSHEIARRLLPDLPRKGLRALAGYFGHSVAPLRRSVAHTAATAAIWRQLVILLKRSHGVHTHSDLKRWLESTPVPSATGRRYPMPENLRRNLPNDSGVYRFVRSNGDLLYIGKATSLRQRVNSHFRTSGRRSEKSLEMLTQASGLSVTPTGTALEAALLESEQIKSFRPPYNVALQADNRCTWFMTCDFSRFSHIPDRRHRCGPVLHRGPFTTFHSIVEFLTATAGSFAEEPHIDAAILLGLPQKFCPDEKLLLEGIGRFKALHLATGSSRPLRRTLLAIGDRRRRQAKVASDSAAEPPPDGNGETPTGLANIQWSADDVVGRIESVLGQCAWMLRRGRWLTSLSESSLVWSSRRKTNVGLVISGGQVVDRFETTNGDAPPLPPHHNRGTTARQRHLELATYDRLRVLTTELRRLSHAGRTVRLRLGHRRLLTEKCLSEALQWV